MSQPVPDSTRDRVADGTELVSGARHGVWTRIRGLLWTWIVTTISLWVAIMVVPGIDHDGFGSIVGLALVVGLVNLVIRPLLNRLALALGWVGIFFLALFAQTAVLLIAIAVARDVSYTSLWSVFLAAWLASLVATVVGFLDSVDEDEVFLAHVVRTSLRRRGPVETTDEPGVVFIQMDGVPLPLLRFAVMSGNVPTLSRWVREGTHSLNGWTARIPSTTPISQAGLLHGCTEDMPAFRWYEKESSQLLVANHPPDAAVIESRISDGHGLLADGGVSVSNLFSGDAPVSMLTMSGLKKDGLGKSQDYGPFFATPYGFTRSLFRTIGEMFKEVFQARRQVSRNILPRIHRHGSYIALRGITNVIQRDLITALMSEQILNGTKVLYADYLDYDEVAHHAGVAREESLRSMEGVDKVIGMLEKVSKLAPRPYYFVVVSDHGQSQGATFRQRYGKGLEDVVRDLMGGADGVATATGNDEDWGPLNIFLSDLTQQSSISASVTRAVVGGRQDDGAVSLGPRAEAERTVEARPELVVAGSGNLGLVWFAREPGRLTVEDMEQRWPGLVAGLARHPGVSVVVARSEADGIVALGRDGVRQLDKGEVEGIDPFAIFGDEAEHAATDFARAAKFANAPDLYVNSVFDPDTLEVAAFEELVGCHGGVGGWQKHPILVHPAEWEVDDDLVGAEAVHDQMVRWLEALGHRRDLPPRRERAGFVAPS
jgi:uncharacterized membrane protein YvlD (DUF360 family)